jgi:hypothetical protein
VQENQSINEADFHVFFLLKKGYCQKIKRKRKGQNYELTLIPVSNSTKMFGIEATI